MKHVFIGILVLSWWHRLWKKRDEENYLKERIEKEKGGFLYKQKHELKKYSHSVK
jgi:hypothetical protein